MTNKLQLKEYIDDDYFFNIQKAVITSEFLNHAHDFSELVVITGGSATHTVNHERYEVHAGHVFVINPHSSHGFSDVSKMSFYNIMFQSGRFLGARRELHSMPGFQALFLIEPVLREDPQAKGKLKLSPDKLWQAEVLLQSILNEYQKREEGYKVLVQAYFTALVVFLSREYASDDSPSSAKLLRIASAVAYLEKHYMDTVRLRDLADRAYMSSRQFIRIYKQIFNHTPVEHIVNLRLGLACQLLQNSDERITEIASKSGFTDSNYFARAFRSKYGLSPSSFRNEVRK